MFFQIVSLRHYVFRATCNDLTNVHLENTRTPLTISNFAPASCHFFNCIVILYNVSFVEVVWHQCHPSLLSEYEDILTNIQIEPCNGGGVQLEDSNKHASNTILSLLLTLGIQKNALTQKFSNDFNVPINVTHHPLLRLHSIKTLTLGTHVLHQDIHHLQGAGGSCTLCKQ